MSDQAPRSLPLQAIGAIWRNRWARILILIFLAFEIYNTAILPAIRGTYETMGIRAETQAKTGRAVDLSGDDEIARLIARKRELEGELRRAQGNR
jgi:glycosyltransferase A (GT-A) superfamily protein (DUF2064 family)